MLFGWVALMACGLEPLGYEPGSEWSTDVDRGDPVDPIVYPSDTDDRILLYSGHGGNRLIPRTAVSDAWVAAGWTVETADNWPADFDGFRMVMMNNVGSRAAGGQFNADETEQIAQALSDGTRFVFAQRNGACGSTALLGLLDFGLASPVMFNGESITASSSFTLEDLESASQPMQGVSALDVTNPCEVLVSGAGESLASGDAGSTIVASYRPGGAGDIVLVGDMMLFADPGQEFGGNQRFAENLAAVVP